MSWVVVRTWIDFTVSLYFKPVSNLKRLYAKKLLLLKFGVFVVPMICVWFISPIHEVDQSILVIVGRWHFGLFMSVAKLLSLDAYYNSACKKGCTHTIHDLQLSNGECVPEWNTDVGYN